MNSLHFCLFNVLEKDRQEQLILDVGNELGNTESEDKFVNFKDHCLLCFDFGLINNSKKVWERVKTLVSIIGL